MDNALRCYEEPEIAGCRKKVVPDKGSLNREPCDRYMIIQLVFYVKGTLNPSHTV